MRSEFFGEPWPSGLCEDATRVATPVGVPCGVCLEPIAQGDRGGFVVALVDHEAGEKPAHRECLFRAVMGGIAHVMGSPACPCRGGSDPDEGLSRRASAILVWRRLVEHAPREAIERELHAYRLAN